jgi:tellurite resistance protein TehA-like permease
MTRKSETVLSSMSAAWLLPIVACVVCAASGSIVADVLPDPQYALTTIVVSYILWGIGVPLALMIMVIYLMRLMLHKLPPKEIMVSMFLPLGPLGQGSYGYVPPPHPPKTLNIYLRVHRANLSYVICENNRIQKLGQVSQKIFPQTHTLRPGTGEIFEILGFFVGLLLWSFGLLWLFFAVASILRTRKFPFNLGWWAFTFPLGVYATSTCQLGREMPSRFFRVMGTVCYDVS